MKVNSIEDVVKFQLCTGCGACAYIEPSRYRMGDAIEYGRRPFLRSNPQPETHEALKICPGLSLSHSKNIKENKDINKDLLGGWGPIFEVFEGYAADDEIRFAGSSGGAATALALFCLEQQDMNGVLHTGAKNDAPYLNETVISTSRKQLLERTGSRYSPASPAEGLSLIENAKGKSVFIGKPCDVAAAQESRKIRPTLDKNLGLVISFFCAGTPSTKGVLDLFAENDIESSNSITSLRFRGNGWPGMWNVKFNHNEEKQQTYEQSWGFLQKYRQWRCYICPDHTGEFADIAVGDPWYRKVENGELGKSLIVARTKHGLDIINSAVASGYIVLEKNDPTLLPRSQPNLLTTRGALWARLVVLRILGAATPKYIGFELFRYWAKNLTLKGKVQSIIGTVKRVYSKGLNKPSTFRSKKRTNSS